MAVVSCILGFGAVSIAAGGPANALPRTSPEEQGVSSSALLAFVEAADREIDALHGFMLVRHGCVVAEGWWSPYDATTRHSLFSLSKSFTSTAVGLAVAEGKLSVDDEVLKFFPEDAPPEPSTNLKAMRVSDLLRMSAGHETEPSLSESAVWTKAFLAHPVPFKPGTHFRYNTPATYMLSAIVQKATGLTVLEYLRPRLFAPLGIEDPVWGTSPQGISLGGYGLSIRTEDIARFGQLYLRKGEWGGRRVVPAAWVEAATSLQTSNGSDPKSDWDQGYGYQFWRCRHGFYRGDGAFGQFCIAMPEHDAVVAITAGTRDMQAVLNLIWDRLLPAIHSGRLPPDSDAHAKLEKTLAGLKIHMPEASGSPGPAAGQSGKRFVFPANEQKIEAVALEFGGEGHAATLCLRSGGVDQRIACGAGEWKKGRLLRGVTEEQAIAACGAWTAEGTYTAKICRYETPFCMTVGLRFSGDRLLCDVEYNVAFGPTRNPQLVGREGASGQRPEAPSHHGRAAINDAGPPLPDRSFGRGGRSSRSRRCRRRRRCTPCAG
ncbi:MAG: serine hydrolase [Planctomycetes bacterium]|nr:serine hydrolase [Planctomycetota bacterium]